MYYHVQREFYHWSVSVYVGSSTIGRCPCTKGVLPLVGVRDKASSTIGRCPCTKGVLPLVGGPEENATFVILLTADVACGNIGVGFAASAARRITCKVRSCLID